MLKFMTNSGSKEVFFWVKMAPNEKIPSNRPLGVTHKYYFK